MTAKTHILGGVLAGELLCAAASAPVDNAAVLLAAAAAGALLPDIDHHNSKVSRSSKAGRVASSVACALTTHRGVIHTPVFILLCGAVLGALSFFADGLPGGALIAGLLVGMLSHLVLDSLNPSGIMWLWPVSRKRIRFAKIRTSSPFEWLVTAALLALVVGFAARFLPELVEQIRDLAGA